MLVISAIHLGAQSNTRPTPTTMTKMVVRLSGPEIQPGSFSALPKMIYRAGEHYARIEDPPDAKQKIQKLTIIAEPDAYSINLIDKKGTHATDQGGANDLHMPIVLPFDPKHELPTLDKLEFGGELEFFEAAGAQKRAGPIINAKPTDAYEIETAYGPAVLVVRSGSDVPVTLSWKTKAGEYRYEYITYQDLPFQKELFEKPGGIQIREIPPERDGSPG